MRLITTGVFVDDQEKALQFYTTVLGFKLKSDIPVGEFRWITVVSSEDESGTELLLEPNNHPAAKEYQSKIFEDGIPANMFGVKNIQNEYDTLIAKGVEFTMEPTDMGGYKLAIFNDTCGNLIQLIQQ